ncbi:MAG: hypothetical protein U0670_16750 [Anaerolineae bacterium]
MARMGEVDIEEYNQLRMHVAELEAKVTMLMGHLGLTYTPPTAAGMEDVRKLAMSGNLIGAIAEYRKQTGASLQEAKAFVERMMKPNS